MIPENHKILWTGLHLGNHLVVFQISHDTFAYIYTAEDDTFEATFSVEEKVTPANIGKLVNQLIEDITSMYLNSLVQHRLTNHVTLQ